MASEMKIGNAREMMSCRKMLRISWTTTKFKRKWKQKEQIHVASGR